MTGTVVQAIGRPFLSRRWLVCWLYLLLSARAVLAEGMDRAPAGPVTAMVNLIGPRAAQDAAQAVIAEWLARANARPSWSFQATFGADQLFGPSAAMGAVEVWVDLTSSAEVHLYFRDASSKWFVIRWLDLANGLDEIGKEEIGHVVAAAVIALASGTESAMTESSARAALRTKNVPPASFTASSSSAASSGLRAEIAGLGSVQLYARDPLLNALASLSLVLTRGPRWGQGPGSPGVWLDLGYQFPVQYEGQPVSAETSAASLRAGLLWEIRRYRALFLRVGIGGGADRVRYRPSGDATVITLAPEGHFWVPVASVWSGAEARIVEHIGLVLRIFADVALTRVHYDVGNGGSAALQVLTPYRFRPGLSLGVVFPY